MNYLKATTLAVEAGVIATCFGTGLSIATENGGSVIDASPILAIGLIECLRTPVAMRIPQLKLGGAICAIALCIGITPLTGEGMMMAADRLFHARTANVYEAQEVRDAAKAKYDAVKDTKDTRSADIDAANKHLEEVISHAPPPPPVSNCQAKGVVKTKKGAQQWSGSCAADNANAETYRRTQADYQATVAAARADIAKAQAEPAVDVKALETAWKYAESDVIKAKDHSTMHRAAASWFGVSIAELTEGQYEQFARWCMIAIAVSVSTVTMFSAFISNLPTRGGRGSRLSRAIRARLAAKRKTLRRLVTNTVTVYRDRIKYVHVPVDAATGTILANVPPEAASPENVVKANFKAAE